MFLWLCKDRGETHPYVSVKTNGKHAFMTLREKKRRLYGSVKTEGKRVFMVLQRQRGNTSLWLGKNRAETRQRHLGDVK